MTGQQKGPAMWRALWCCSGGFGALRVSQFFGQLQYSRDHVGLVRQRRTQVWGPVVRVVAGQRDLTENVERIGTHDVSLRSVKASLIILHVRDLCTGHKGSQQQVC